MNGRTTLGGPGAESGAKVDQPSSSSTPAPPAAATKSGDIKNALFEVPDSMGGPSITCDSNGYVQKQNRILGEGCSPYPNTNSVLH